METELFPVEESAQDERLIPSSSFTPPSLAPSQFKQLELLQHLALYSELLIVVIGEEGIGKSFLAKSLVASREDPDFSILIEADFMLGIPAILQKIGQAANLESFPDDVESGVQVLSNFCQQLVEDDQSFLLIVDQADQLDSDTLFAVAQLALIAPANFHVALFGRPALEADVLSMPEPQAPVHVAEVEPLSNEESEVVILESFPDEDWQSEQLDQILDAAVGNPGTLLLASKRFLEGGALENDNASVANIQEFSFPITHVAALILIGSILVMSYLYSTDSSVSTEISADGVLNDDVFAIDAVEVTAPLIANVGGVESNSIELGAMDSNKEAEVDFNYSTPAVALESSEQGVAQIDNDLTNTVVEPDSKLGVKASAASPLEAASTENEAAVEAPSHKLDEKILLAAPKANYVIQLFGSHKLKNAQDFQQEYKSKVGGMLIYQAEHNNKPWYVVVTGPYVNRKAGIDKVARLPKKLRAQNPWVRSIASVQKSINN